MELVYETKLGKLYYGDSEFVDDIIEDNSLDLVFTDPPYPKKYFHCFEFLAEIYPKKLMSGGSLFTLLGHYQLEDVMALFRDKLKYRWLISILNEGGSHPRMAMGIEVCFKPMLWYVKDKFPRERNYGFLRDILRSEQHKELHKWQQHIFWANYYIKKVTKENELVCDPFCGSGTVPIACEELNRKWIAIDNDLTAIQTTIERLKKFNERDLPFISNFGVLSDQPQITISEN